MCARYGFSEVQAEEILQIVKEIEQEYGEGAWKPRDIHPTDKALVIISDAGKRVPQLYTWGYKTAEKPIINARSETAESLDIFSDSIKNQRCAVPCTCFFEWDRTKRKHRFTLPDSVFSTWRLFTRSGMVSYAIASSRHRRTHQSAKSIGACPLSFLKIPSHPGLRAWMPHKRYFTPPLQHSQ